MLHVFENTKRIPSRHGPHADGEVAPYINAEATGLPAAADDSDRVLFDALSSLGTPVPIPEGLEHTDMRRLA